MLGARLAWVEGGLGNARPGARGIGLRLGLVGEDKAVEGRLRAIALAYCVTCVESRAASFDGIVRPAPRHAARGSIQRAHITCDDAEKDPRASSLWMLDQLFQVLAKQEPLLALTTILTSAISVVVPLLQLGFDLLADAPFLVFVIHQFSFASVLEQRFALQISTCRSLHTV